MKKRTLTYEAYVNKVHGGWLGKSIGGTVGAPFEAHKIFGNMTCDNCWPEKIYPNDDLDIQVVWLELLEEVGPYFTRGDLVRIWQDRCWYNFAEYGYFLYNEQRGIHTPHSGRFNNIFYRQSEGCPIRAEIWGMVSPGNACLAAEYARMDGELDHIENSVWAEQFWAAAVSEAFFANEPEEALEAGRKAIPDSSDIYRISYEVPELWQKYRDLKRVWKEFIRRYGHRDGSKAEINFAFSLLPLYAGKGDFKETIVTAINCGWDSDCTAATAGALLGVLSGAAALPADWKQKMGETLSCDVNVRHKTSLISEFAADTCKAGLEAMLSRNRIIDIINTPEEILIDINKRKETRLPQAFISMEAHYPDEPVLYRDRVTETVLKIKHSGLAPYKGSLIITAPEGVIVSPCSTSLNLLPGNTHEILINISRDPESGVIWDKNPIEVCLKLENGESFTYVFGLAGSRQWQAYGPYWDAWDTTKSDICPYRNSGLISHPVFVEGCQSMLVHEYVRLDREYLDEACLVKEEIPEEIPYLIERGEDHIDNEHLSGFFGEACFYLVRNIVSCAPVECNVNIGATGPFVIWMDGEEVLRSEESLSWSPHDFSFRARFDNNSRRIVIKCIRPGDYFRFSMCFIKLDVPGDNTKGVSYLLDSMGDVVCI